MIMRWVRREGRKEGGRGGTEGCIARRETLRFYMLAYSLTHLFLLPSLPPFLLSLTGSLDSWGETILHPPKTLSGASFGKEGRREGGREGWSEELYTHIYELISRNKRTHASFSLSFHLKNKKLDHRRLSALSCTSHPGDDDEDGIVLWQRKGKGKGQRQEDEEEEEEGGKPHEERKLKGESYRQVVGGA